VYMCARNRVDSGETAPLLTGYVCDCVCTSVLCCIIHHPIGLTFCEAYVVALVALEKRFHGKNTRVP